jgi:predicted lipopolysaccharide heptosyltransferase III
MERILAIQIKRIGDLILTAPALARLKRARPQARLVLVTMGLAGDLAEAIPAVDEHHRYHYRRPNLGLWADLLTNRYAAALDFSGTDRSALMTLASRAERRATYEKRARGLWRERIYTHVSLARLRDFHTIEHMAALLDTLDLPSMADISDTPPSLAIPAATAEKMALLLGARGVEGPYAVVHPGTARPEKYWLPERWARVIDAVSSRMTCVITGGNDATERRHVEAILAACRGRKPLVLAGELTLLETAAVIARCEQMLGVDTAAMHLAAAFRRPQVALFGPTNPYHWRPLNPLARVVFAGQTRPMTVADWQPQMDERPMSEISVEQVLEAMDI